MFENLSDKLQRVFKNLRGEGRLTAENMDSALREIRVALLEADVNFRVVKQLIENIKEKAMGEEALGQRAADRDAHGGLAGIGQNDFDRQAGAMAFEERASAHDGVGGRLP